jgi:hypothetical protein
MEGKLWHNLNGIFDKNPVFVYGKGRHPTRPDWLGIFMGGNSGDQEAGDRAAAADYVAELSAELAKLARRHGLETLGYILDMARLEAESANRHMNGRR